MVFSRRLSGLDICPDRRRDAPPWTALRATARAMRAQSMATAMARKMAENVMAKNTATTPLSSPARRCSLGGTPAGLSAARSPRVRKSRKFTTAQVPQRSKVASGLRMPQQVLPTPQGADVAVVQFEDNWRPRRARRANQGGGAVCGRRRAEPFVAALAAMGAKGAAPRPRRDQRLKPCAPWRRRLQRLRRQAMACACHSRNVTSRQRYLGQRY